MKRFSMMQIFCALFLLASQALNAQNMTGSWMKYSNPEEAGFNTQKLQLVDDQYRKMRSASFMVIHKGKVLISKGDVSRRYMTHSIRKSFMSAIYGIYEAKGIINLYKTLDELSIDDKLGLSPKEKQTRVLDLITARSGIYHPAAYEPRDMKKNRPERGHARPGERFFYNNWDFNTLLPILQQEAGIDFFDAFIDEIATPLGMEDLRKQDMQYRLEPELSNYPAYLFKMSARDMARFGQLYLDEGKWNNEQIIPKQWVAESTDIYTHNPEGFEGRGGYGYLWWVDPHTFGQPVYYASGLNGHRAYVFPESDLVVIHQVNTYLMMGEREANIVNLIKLVLEAQTGEGSDNPKTEPLQVKGQEIPQFDLSAKDFAKFEGDYTHRFFRKITVYSEDGKFFIKGDILGLFEIFPKSKTEFIVDDLPELPGFFEKATSENPKGTAITWSDEHDIPRKIIIYY